jgi:putative tRNA adenosine deaminase-associated protein
MADDEGDEVDFVVAAYRSGGVWRVDEMKSSLGHDLEAMGEALARFRSDVGVLALMSVNDDFFVLARRDATGTRLVLSDVTAVEESDLAGDVADLMDLPDLDDDEDPQPGGDLDMLADLGVSADDLADVCDDDDDASAEDMLLDLADRLGFADELEAALE